MQNKQNDGRHDLHKRLQKNEIKKYVKWMGNAVCALSILFVLSAFFRIDFHTAVMGRNWKLLFPVCMAGVCLKTVTVFLSGSAWCCWLDYFSGERCSRKEALRVYAKANIGKYLPGNVMHYVERNLFAGKLNLPQKQIAAASLLEVISLAAAACAIGVLFAFDKVKETAAVLAEQLFSGSTGVAGLPVIGFLAAGLLAAAAAAVCRHCRNRNRRHAGRPAFFRAAPGTYLSGKDIRRLGRVFAGSCFRYAAVLCILGLILVFLYWCWAGLPELHFQQAALITAAYSTAWVLGFIIPGTPGGIGVREMALTVMLSSVMGRDAAAAVSILHRMITIIGDFAAYLLRFIPAGRNA